MRTPPPDDHETRVAAGVTALAEGRMVVVTDDADRENEGDLVMAAQFATPDAMAFFVRHGTGLVCVPMTPARVAELGLPMMVAENTEAHGTAFTVSVDHVSTGTGVCAADRCATVRALADPATGPADLRRPGHVFPLRARDGGVVRRAGHTEAALDLLQLAGLAPVGVIVELVTADGSMLRGDELAAFAVEHALPVLTVADLLLYRRRHERLVTPTGSAVLPTSYGEFRATSFRSSVDSTEHLALVMGDVTAPEFAAEGVLVRVHSECLTGDILGSARCDCGDQLQRSMAMIAAEGRGVVVYLRGHEGRGIGLGHKLRAYALQDGGRDTVDANRDLGLPVDDRDYGAGADILAALGVRRIRLITNNPAKHEGLAAAGVEIVTGVATPSTVTEDNVRYLGTKRDRMGHTLDLGAGELPLAGAARP